MKLFLELLMAGSEDEWKILCVVRGYHVYSDMWNLYLEDEFMTKHQRCNPHDKYAIAILRTNVYEDKIVVGTCQGNIEGVLLVHSP